MRKFMAAAMDPSHAAEQVLAGIRRNDLYIFTHQEFAPPTRERMEALLAAFPAEEAPRARAMLARRFVSEMYALERDRLLSQRRR